MRGEWQLPRSFISSVLRRRKRKLIVASDLISVILWLLALFSSVFFCVFSLSYPAHPHIILIILVFRTVRTLFGLISMCMVIAMISAKKPM